MKTYFLLIILSAGLGGIVQRITATHVNIRVTTPMPPIAAKSIELIIVSKEMLNARDKMPLRVQSLVQLLTQRELQ